MDKQREAFERIHCGGNLHTTRRNEHGDYVLPSVQDAWSGWQSALVYASLQPPAVQELPQSVLEFDTFLNEPPDYEELRMVRDYRHEAYPKWQRVVNDIRKAFAASPLPQAAPSTAVPEGSVDLQEFRQSLKGLKYMDIDSVDNKDVHNKAIDEALWLLDNFISRAAAPVLAMPMTDHNEYRNNLLESAANWFASRAETVWAKQFNYSWLMTEYAQGLREIRQRLLSAAPALPVLAAEQKPSDCSGDPSSCPDNEGRGCYCSDNGIPAAEQKAQGEVPDENMRDAIREAIGAALGEAMDCTRAWSAWGVGTMSQNDFELVADNDERLEEIVDAVCALLTHPTALSVVDAQKVRNEAMEEAAVVCDQIEGGEYPNGDTACGLAWECAEAIRLLQSQPASAGKDAEEKEKP